MTAPDPLVLVGDVSSVVIGHPDCPGCASVVGRHLMFEAAYRQFQSFASGGRGFMGPRTDATRLSVFLARNERPVFHILDEARALEAAMDAQVHPSPVSPEIRTLADALARTFPRVGK